MFQLNFHPLLVVGKNIYKYIFKPFVCSLYSNENALKNKAIIVNSIFQVNQGS